MAQIFSSDRGITHENSPHSKVTTALDGVENARAKTQDQGLAQMQQRADRSAGVNQLARLSELHTPVPHLSQRKKKGTDGGLPGPLQSGMEAMSGVDLSGVQVHYNSSEPAQLGAHAFAQGTDIHLGSGQEKHLPHEAWHVVQQAQGRVKPTQQLKSNVAINDDEGLEKEADVMGAKALQRATQMKQIGGTSGLRSSALSPATQNTPYQRRADEATMWTPTPGLFQLMSAGQGAFAGQEAPIQQAMDGMGLASMSNTAYAQWQGTTQCKMAPHGAISIGGQTLVTQYKDAASVVQMLSWPKLSSKKLDRVKGGLVALEGALTFSVSLAAGLLSGGIGAVPAIMGMIVGAVKFARGALMAIEVSDANKGIKTKVVDIMRGLEAAGGLVGASHVEGFKKLPLIIFGVAKSLRSLATAMANYMGEETGWPMLRKGLLMFATAAHAIEAFALIIAGLDASALAEYMGAAGGAVIGLSKGFRAGIQGGEAADAPSGRGSTAKSEAEPEVVDAPSGRGSIAESEAEPEVVDAPSRRGSTAESEAEPEVAETPSGRGSIADSEAEPEVVDAPSGRGSIADSEAEPEVVDAPSRRGSTAESEAEPEVVDAPSRRGSTAESEAEPEVVDAPSSRGSTAKSEAEPEVVDAPSGRGSIAESEAEQDTAEAPSSRGSIAESEAEQMTAEAPPMPALEEVSSDGSI